jgi:type I restriction enzyme S subunit
MRDGWTETALGSVLKLSNKKLGPHKEEPEIFAISKYDGVVLAQDYFDRRIASKSLNGYKVIGPGDWVYSTIHIDEGSIAVNHFPFQGVVSPMYTSMIWDSRLHDCRFFEFLLKSDAALIRYQENAQGTVNRRRSLSWKAFSEMTFFVPPLAEQKRIVDVVSSIDAYIVALQQEADMAHTARNAVFHELLSAGGHDWTETTINEVLLVSIGGIWGGDIGTDELDVHVYRQTEFNDNGHLTVPSDAIRSITPNQLKSRRIQPGDILLQKSAGTPTLPGRVVRVPEGIESNSTCSNFLQLIRVDSKKCDPDFLFWELWFRHRSGGAFEFQRGTNIRNLDLNQYFAQSLHLPSFTEQRRIVEIVSSMDGVIQTTEQALTDAKNLRSGLLSDLLSGNHEIPASYDSLLGAA